MIGKVIEGRYVGASVNKLPDKNVLYIQTEDGSKIALSKNNVISIDDVTEQYPSGGRKVMMVMWNDFETSIIQLGKQVSNVNNSPDTQIKQNDPKKHSARKKKHSGKILALLLLLVFFVVAAFAVIKPKIGNNSESNAMVTLSPTTESSTSLAVYEVPIIETTIPETIMTTEPLIKYADEAFLEAIELSVSKRNELLQTDFKQYELINIELAIIREFENAEFKDSELYALVCQYLKGLYLQEESLDLIHSEKQIKWQEGVVERYSALIALHDQYNVFADDPDFVSTYVLEQEKNIRVLQALKAVEADLVAQLDGVTLQYKSQNKYTATYTNNTDYDFDINFYFWYYDANGTRIDEWSTYFTNILPKKHTIFEFWCPSAGRTFDFEWDIILPEMRQ